MKFLFNIVKFLFIVYIFVGLILIIITFPPESFSEILKTIFIWPYYLLQGFAAASLL